MANMEWLQGDIWLPANEVARVRRVVRKRHNHLIDKAYDALKRFRHQNPTASRSKWAAAISKVDNPRNPNLTIPLRIAMKIARSLEKPRAVKWDDFNSTLNYDKATVNHDVFPLFANNGDRIGVITFTGRKMSWTIFPGNHAVDIFYDSFDYKFMQKLCSSIYWARGSGGGDTIYSERDPETPQVDNRYGSTGKRYKPALTYALNKDYFLNNPDEA